MNSRAAALFLIVLMFIGQAAFAILPNVAQQRTLTGTYTIVNRASGRRICSGTACGFSATAGGPLHAITPDHRWRLAPQGDAVFTIVNAANGLRILAQSGKNEEAGFMTTDGRGPLYQDQKWNLWLQSDGSYVLANARSGRRMAARVGFDGSSGFVAASSDQPITDDQKWWFIDPDVDEVGLLLQELRLSESGLPGVPIPQCTAQPPEDRARLEEELDAQHNVVRWAQQRVQQLQAYIQSERIVNSRLNKEVQDGHTAVATEILARSALEHQIEKCGAEKVRLVSKFFNLGAVVGLVAAMIALVCVGYLVVKRFTFSSGPDLQQGCPNAISHENTFSSGITYRIFSEDPDVDDSRSVKIQCPGVEREDVEIELIWKGCDVSIHRRASLGVEAFTWRKRFEFDHPNGIFEFRDDLMVLEHGFLRLVFHVRAFQSRAARFPQKQTPQTFCLDATDRDDCWDVDCVEEAWSTTSGTGSVHESDTEPSSSVYADDLTFWEFDSDVSLKDRASSPHRRRGVAVGGA